MTPVSCVWFLSRKAAPLLLAGFFIILEQSIAWNGGCSSRRSVVENDLNKTKRLSLPSLFPLRPADGGRDGSDDEWRIHHQDRRQILQTVLAFGSSIAGVSIVVVPGEAQAGEIGSQITKAVTQSDLGISVRQSVVRGAQVMDGIDGKLEQLADQFGLGSERAKRPGRPEPIVIKNPQPFQGNLAQAFLDTSDRVFVSLAKVKATDLVRQIEKVATAAGPSFVRSGLPPEDVKLTSSATTLPRSSAQFDFFAYVHFKAYGDLLIDQTITSFSRKSFENQVGEEVGRLLLASSLTPKGESNRREALSQAMDNLDQLCDLLVQNGFIAMIDKAPLDQDQVQDWVDDISELTWSIALNGDITLRSQRLLQEQGFRLYPNYARYAVQTMLESFFPDQEVSVEDYYLDTDFTANPEKFEVKQVLMNIEIDSP